MIAPSSGDEWIATLTGLEAQKDAAYLERNKLVALLASIFPAGIKQTAIEGWSEDWHGCVYIDFPWGQASWHYHDSQAALFQHLPPYPGEWDGHTTDQKYDAIQKASRDGPTMHARIAAAEARGLKMAADACGPDNGPWLPSPWACRQAILALIPPPADGGDNE